VRNQVGKNNNMSFQYIKPTDEQVATMQSFRDRFEQLASDIELAVPESRGRSLAITKLEETAFWLNKAITHNS